MNQFEIYSIELDHKKRSPLQVTRLVVIISPNVMNRNLKTVIVAPLTAETKGYPSRMFFEFEEQDFEIVLDQLRVIDKSRLKKKLGAIDQSTAAKIKAIVQTMFS